MSAFALGLLLGAAKIGFIATIGFGVGWWRSNRKLRRLEAERNGVDPALLEERLSNLERLSEYTASQVDLVVEQQGRLIGSPASAADNQRADRHDDQPTDGR